MKKEHPSARATANSPKNPLRAERLLLRIKTTWYVAGSTWQQDDKGLWRCVRAAPIVDWMVGRSRALVETYLRRKGFVYEWLEVPAQVLESTENPERKE